MLITIAVTSNGISKEAMSITTVCDMNLSTGRHSINVSHLPDLF